ncbi:hypothetical protein [Fibrella forsythiae]|uniref:Phage head morphogenesis domain-containing protein n=1 Tax=Fibrella forsythiae TaxID=2817061 RepID=A0ABS3JBD6_9BACT|nr:hypothetical protein [Fibrella forsythiae]MBO0947305.1 hypothetical protein [Fibrella forsythiae]
MSKPFPWSDWQSQHLARIDAYAAQIDILYQMAIREAVALAGTLSVDPKKPFRFASYPQTNERLKNLLQNMTLGMQTIVARGTADAWEGAGVKADAMVSHLMQTGQLSTSLAAQYMGARNGDALAAFQVRKVGGLGLSQRVFNYTGQFKQELELGLDVGINAGQSASQLSQSIRQYLQNPDQLFRRVRNERGQLVLSKAAKAYSPGRGVYRSSYKNAMRLTRTEINRSYREADSLRYQTMPFVVGIEVRRSNRGHVCDVCESLKGRYPKDFVFRGWHPQCRCNVISILATAEEMQKLTEMVLNGEDLSGFRSVNQIDKPHQGWANFVNTNRDKLNAAPVKPLFITENKPFVQAVKPQPAVQLTPFEAMKAAGWDPHGRTEEKFNELFPDWAGFDFDLFGKQVTKTLTEAGITVEKKQLTAYMGKLNMIVEGHKGKEYFYLERDFYRERQDDGSYKRVVKHEYLSIPDSLQGGGLSKQLFKDLYAQYTNASIDLIKVQANITVGGYAWARYGFTFSYQPDRRMVNSMAQKNLRGKDLEAFNKLWSRVKDEELFPMHLIAQQPFGKKLLLGTDWNGVMDLGNKEQRALFEDYLFGR